MRFCGEARALNAAASRSAHWAVTAASSLLSCLTRDRAASSESRDSCTDCSSAILDATDAACASSDASSPKETTRVGSPGASASAAGRFGWGRPAFGKSGAGTPLATPPLL